MVPIWSALFWWSVSVHVCHSFSDIPGQPEKAACLGFGNCDVGWRCEKPTDASGPHEMSAMGVCELCQGQDDCNGGGGETSPSYHLVAATGSLIPPFHGAAGAPSPASVGGPPAAPVPYFAASPSPVVLAPSGLRPFDVPPGVFAPASAPPAPVSHGNIVRMPGDYSRGFKEAANATVHSAQELRSAAKSLRAAVHQLRVDTDGLAPKKDIVRGK